MTGLIREIRRIYSAAEITLVVHPRSLELAETCPYVNEVIPNPQTNLINGNMLLSYYDWNVKFARQFLEQKIDICYGFTGYTYTCFLMYMSGAKTRVTFDHPNYGKPAVSQNNDVSINQAMTLINYIAPYYKFNNNVVDLCFSLIDNIIHVPVSNRDIEIWYTPLDITVAKSALRNARGKIYALCMGGTNLVKCYPPQLYAKVLEMILSEEPDSTFVLLGGGLIDLRFAEILKNSISKNYSEKIIDLVGKINYRQSSAILTMCVMYIGNDTGTMHAAAAVKCPVLMPLAFPADIPCSPRDVPKSCYPYNVPNVIIQPKHALVECATNNENHSGHGCKANVPHCITQIKPETVFEGFKLLKKRIEQKITEPLYIN